MAKYNLLDDDDIFDEKEDISEYENNIIPERKDQPAPVDMTDDIDISIDDDEDDLLDTTAIPSLDDKDFQTDLDITAVDNDTMEEEISEPEIENQSAREYEEYQPEQQEQNQEYNDSPPFITDDYEDEKQEGINYKPFVIAFVIIAFLVGIYFVLDTFVFSEKEEVVEEPVKTPEQLQQEKEAAEKAAFLGRVAGKTSSEIKLVSNLIDYGQTNAKVSSILLYDESLLFEVFGNTRDQVAKVNMALKNNNLGKNFEVIGSETRPGAKGGVFGLFKTQLSGDASSRDVTQAHFSSITDFESWIQQTSNAQALKVVTLKNNFQQDEGYFKRYKVETTVNGSIDACNSFLEKLGSENNQIKINKLNLNAADQRNFQTKKYQLKLILELYV